jgi:hypothetical protein
MQRVLLCDIGRMATGYCTALVHYVHLRINMRLKMRNDMCTWSQFGAAIALCSR